MAFCVGLAVGVMAGAVAGLVAGAMVPGEGGKWKYLVVRVVYQLPARSMQKERLYVGRDVLVCCLHAWFKEGQGGRHFHVETDDNLTRKARASIRKKHASTLRHTKYLHDHKHEHHNTKPSGSACKCRCLNAWQAT